MKSSSGTSMVFNCLIKKDENYHIGHCLELDIVVTAKTIEEVKNDLGDVILAQVDYAFSNDNLENLFRPAPAEVWKEFYECRTQTEEKMELNSAYKKKESLKKFVPPWIIAKTCLSADLCHA
jgi:hypothetical protein